MLMIRDGRAAAGVVAAGAGGRAAQRFSVTFDQPPKDLPSG